jgi:tRNA A-37 threonylcarbamoyl transferase component Bud32
MKLDVFDNVKDLLSVNFDHQPHFVLKIQGEELFCERILRLIPGRRIVVQGIWNKQKVVAKLFIDIKRARAQADAEKRGFDALKKAAIPTPELLLVTELSMPGLFTAIYSEIPESTSLHKQLRTNHPIKNKVFFEKAILLIKKLHDNNLIQADCHLDNVLIQGDELYLIDCKSIVTTALPAEKHDNLILFCAQLSLSEQPLLDKVMPDALTPDFLEALKQARIKRATHFLKKTTRTSSQFISHKNLDRSYTYQRQYHSKALLELLNNPEAFLESAEKTIIKNGNSATLFKTWLDDKEVIIKRYNIKDPWHFITHSFKTTRAKVSWQYACLLQLFDIPSPAPIAYLETKHAGLSHTSYFIMENLPGKNLLDYCASAFPQTIFEQTTALIHAIQSLQIAHHDLKATNFFVSYDRVFLVDLDHMALINNLQKWQVAAKADIKRFRRNWVHNPRLAKAFDEHL